MKRFQFRFETVLGVKKLNEEVVQSQLADLQTQVKQAVIAKEECIETIHGTEQSLLFEMQKKIPMNQLSIYLNYINALKHAVSIQEVKINRLETEVDSTRDRLIQATQEKKVFENLKNREHNKYLSHIAKEEQKFLDEVTMTHHNRKS